MHVFVTGATGFIGAAVTADLLAAGHSVTGLARSAEKAMALAEAGAEVLMGNVNDLHLLARTCGKIDAVAHLAFNHDFTRFKENCEDDRKVIHAMGQTLVGTGKPMVVTSGIPAAPGRASVETDSHPGSDVMPRAASEEAAHEALAAGANMGIIRLPQVHDTAHFGLITFFAQVARQTGFVGYAGDGSNLWPATHVSDAARVYRLALERAAPGAVYHAAAEAGVPAIEVSEALAKGMDLPVRALDGAEVESYFGPLTHFSRFNILASSYWTREVLGWQPTGPGLLEDLRRIEDFA